MSIDNLTDDGEEERLRNTAFRLNLSQMEPRELAYRFRIGDESQKMIIKSYLETLSQDYKQQFNDASEDPSLGERPGDDFDDEW